MTRSIVAVALIGLCLTGCSCYKTLRQSMSYDKALSAEVVQGGHCGGATVGYTTNVMLQTSTLPYAWLGNRRSVFAVRGESGVVLEWTGRDHLLVTYSDVGLTPNDILRKETNWKGVHITYRTF